MGLEAFLSAYPNIRLVDVHADKIELQGEYQLKAQLAGSRFIERTFSLRIVCPSEYPRALPVVFDTAGYFPRNQDFHTYSDGSFCLGSDLKIKSILKADSSLTTFFEKIVVRFLYSVSHRVEFGNFPYGELDHGEKGLIDDYSQLFNVNVELSFFLPLPSSRFETFVARNMHFIADNEELRVRGIMRWFVSCTAQNTADLCKSSVSRVA